MIFTPLLKIFNRTVNLFINNYFKFSGRANCKEYISLTIFCYLLFYILSFILKIFISNVLIGLLLLFVVISIPEASVTIRRLHDFNVSGWWYLLFAIITSTWFVFLGTVIYFNNVELISNISLVFINVPFALIKSTNGTNRYGEPPKG
jgi:uncharacterized membrane protein YhaH (DUF805 family)